MIGSYPSIYSVGHRAVAELFNAPVQVEEKIDGSQFSFCAHHETGELEVRSKGAQMIADAPEAMFKAAVESAREMLPLLKKGWVYRAEYLAKPKHNTLAYARIPARHLMLFDVQTGLETYMSYEEKAAEAARLGLEVVPLLFSGVVGSADQFRAFLDRDSILGNTKIEGVVCKPVGYGIYGPDKKVLLAKFVSEAFKETHRHEWRETNPQSGDIIERLIAGLTTEARWHKAVQHLREAGKLQESPRDIGALMLEVQADTEKECADEIRDALFAWAWPQIRRKISNGLPEWYKEQLVKLQFERDAARVSTPPLASASPEATHPMNRAASMTEQENKMDP